MLSETHGTKKKEAYGIKTPAHKYIAATELQHAMHPYARAATELQQSCNMLHACCAQIYSSMRGNRDSTIKALLRYY